MKGARTLADEWPRDWPEMPLPQGGDITAERLDSYALECLRASRALYESSQIKGSDNHIGPTMLLLGHAFELFLKARLLEQGVVRDLKGLRSFGHDLWRMWTDTGLTNVRHVLLAQADRVLPDDRKHPPVEWHIAFLSKLVSRDTGYALRYPEETVVTPRSGVLFVVLEIGLSSPQVVTYLDSDEIVPMSDI